jgi:hypothetical protein
MRKNILAAIAIGVGLAIAIWLLPAGMRLLGWPFLG